MLRICFIVDKYLFLIIAISNIELLTASYKKETVSLKIGLNIYVGKINNYLFIIDLINLWYLN